MVCASYILIFVYTQKNNLQNNVITREQQKKLFQISYNRISADAKRLATKSDVQRMYGRTDWGRLNSKIKDVVVDLRYRGDYTAAARRKIQKAIVKNDLRSFKKLMSDEDFWVKKMKVPKDRFQRRKDALLKPDKNQ